MAEWGEHFSFQRDPTWTRCLAELDRVPVLLEPRKFIHLETPAMTEAEWLSSTDPAALLRYLLHGRSGTLTRRDEPNGGFTTMQAILLPCPGVSDRKLRLFACACCRQVWDGMECPICRGKGMLPKGLGSCLNCGGKWGISGSGRVGGLTDSRSRAAVEVAEKFADGLATEGQLQTAELEAWTAAESKVVRYVCYRHANQAAPATSHHCGVPPATQAHLLRCLFGNPWRPKLAVWDGREPPRGYVAPELLSWLSWQGGTVPALAARIYDERDWSDLPLLADMLEEAGCVDEDVLNHCRGPGPHGRGCWVVDLLLGKA